MKPKEIDRWGKLRQGGMLKYVLLTGILSWGFPMFVVMTFFLIPHGKLSVLQSAALWLSAGAAYGISTWIVQEYRFRKATDTSRV